VVNIQLVYLVKSRLQQRYLNRKLAKYHINKVTLKSPLIRMSLHVTKLSDIYLIMVGTTQFSLSVD